MATGQFSVVPTDATIQEGRSHLPGDLTVTTIATIGGQGTVTVGSGGTGVRHVVTHCSFAISMTSVISTTTLQIAVIDGASGGKTFLWLSQVTVSGTQGINIDTPNMQAYGSANTQLTAEFSAGINSTTQSVTLQYHDIGMNTA